MKLNQLVIICASFLLATQGFAQKDMNETSEATSVEPEKTQRDPIEFHHQPLLLLKFAPLAAFAHDNAFMFGAELAPPFGKFSFNFDYGKGTGKWNAHKLIRQEMPDMKTEIYKGEIRGYFSDWYPFYALDRKPFGRYWALEYGTKKVTKSPEAAIAADAIGQYAEFKKVPVVQKEQFINVKIGRHIMVRKFFFIDVYAGIGIRKYKVVSTDENFDANSVLFYSIINKWKNWLPGDKGILPNATAGFRLCLPL